MALGPRYQTGAPPEVRAAVAALRDRNDKLAALRQLYPDAQPSATDPDNFTYTDPKTGRLRLVTPKDTNMATLSGDISAWAPTVAELGGGLLGAAAVIPGMVGGPAGGVAAGLAGAGLGGAAGREIATKNALFQAGMTDPRGLPHVFGDVGTDVAANAAGEGVGRLVARGIGRVTPFVADATGQLAERLGIPLTSGQASGSSMLGKVESALRQSPFGGRVRATDRQAGEAGDRIVSETADRLIPRGLPHAIGAGGRSEVLGGAVQRAAERHAAWASGEVDTIASLISSTRDGGRVSPVALEGLRRDLLAELAQAPQSREAALRPALQHLDRIIADAAPSAANPNGGLDFRTAMRLRTDLGKIMADTAPGGTNPTVAGPAIDRIYGAVREDLLRTAGNADLANQTVAQAAGRPPSPSLYARMRAFDDQITDLRDVGGSQTVLEKLAKEAETDSFQGKFTLSRLIENPNRARALIAGLERNGEADAAMQLRASVLDEFGRATSGGQNAAGDAFSFNTFLTNYDKARKSGALDAIFHDASSLDRRALDNIAEVAGRLRGLRAGDNTSNSAGAVTTLAGMSGLGGAYGYVTGDDSGANKAISGAITGALIPLVSSRMLATPGFARWLSRTLTAAETAPAANLGGHLGRLEGIKVNDAETRAELDKLKEAIRLDDTLGPLYQRAVKTKADQRGEVAPELLPPPPGLMGGPQPTGLAAGPPAMPPGLLGTDPQAAAASQYAANAANPGGGLPPGLLAQDPEAILRAMMAGGQPGGGGISSA
jgi:hypothetical protein